MKRTPPRLATRLLTIFLRDDLSEEVRGDLDEMFLDSLKRKSLFKARVIYWYQVLNYLRPFAMRNKRKSSQNQIVMLRHNLLMSYRNFRRYKSSFFINLMGLSTGLAAAFMIYLWINDEISFDKFHQNDARLFQLMEKHEFPDRIDISDESTGLLAQAVAQEMPEVEYATATAPSSWFQKVTLSIGDRYVKASGQYVGNDYLKIFSFPLIAGDKSKALSDKNSIVISRDLSMRLFGSVDNVVGKPIEFQHEREFLVSGILENLPVASSEQFEFLLSFDYFKEVQPWVVVWNQLGPHNFVVLKEGADVEQFNAKIANIAERHAPGGNRIIFALPFSDNYLYNTFDHGTRQGGRIEYVRLFAIIAIFILVIACINFMNLSTARATRRLKEVGIKKVVGAKKTQLIWQFISESFMVTLLSLLVALIITVILLPQFNQLTGKQIQLTWDLRVLMGAFAMLVGVSLVAGSYPAFYLSGFNPAAILKGKLNSSLGEIWARTGLVTFQFTLSVILIVAVVVVYKQIEFIQTKNLGYNKDHIIRFDSEGKVLGTQEAFIPELLKIPGVVNASGSYHNIIGRNFSTSGIEWEGKAQDDNILFEGMIGGYDLLETLGMKIVEGRNFSRDYSDFASTIVFNEAAIKVMGIKDPVGKHIKFQGTDCQIIGVLKDFHFESLHMAVKPMYYRIATQSDNFWYKIMVKLEAGKERETIERIEAFYKTYNPGFVLDYSFLDQAFQKQYQSELRVAKLSRYFAAIAILISCLGLFGLTAFTAERRVKEIGIRKVLGASQWGIVYLLSIEFTKMVLTAIFIALPLSYFLCAHWLDSFAYRIDLKIWFFVGAGLMALLIAWFTVSFQAVRAAWMNPVNSLKSE